MSALMTWLAALPAIALLALAAWAVATARRNVGLVDVAWSLFFLLAAALFALRAPPLGLRGWIAIALVATWARTTIFSTAEVVGLSRAALEEPEVQAGLAEWATDQLFAGLDADDALAERLPPELQEVASVVGRAAHLAVEQALTRALSDEDTQRVLSNAIGVAHHAARCSSMVSCAARRPGCVASVGSAAHAGSPSTERSAAHCASVSTEISTQRP